MTFNSIDKSANILRNIVDSSTQSNFAIIGSLKRTISAVFDDDSCDAKLGTIIDFNKGIELLQQKYPLNNLDLAYILILVARLYQFREDRGTVYLCDEKAISPIFQKLGVVKPKLSRDDKIKSAILKSFLASIEKDDEYIIRTLIRAVPEFLERAKGVNYTGRYLSINEWIKLKEDEAGAKWEINEDGGMLIVKNTSFVPWIFANLIILMIRGYFLQEIPSVGGSTYTFVRRTHL